MPPVDTAIDTLLMTGLNDAGKDERAVGRLVGGVDPQPRRGGVGGDVGIDLRPPRRRDDETDTLEIIWAIRPGSELGDGGAIELSGHLWRHDTHHCPGGGQPGDLAGGDRTGADDEDGHAGHVQGDRVVERTHERGHHGNSDNVD